MYDTSVFCGERVALRPFEPDDAPALRAYLNHPRLEGRRYIRGQFSEYIPLSIRQTQDILMRWAEVKKGSQLAVIEQASGTLVGHARMDWWWDTHCPNLSVVIDPARWRAGFGSDAIGVLLRYLFTTTAAHVAQTWCEDWNLEGLRFVTACGFTDVGRMRRTGIHDGRYVDTISYDLLRREWERR